MQRLLYSLTAELNNYCDLDCVHCYLKGENSNELSCTEFIRFVEKCLPLGLLKVTLTGGEPLYHPQIIEILQILQSYNVSICLMSSLNVENNFIIETILEKHLCDEIRTSIYGCCGETHDTITQKEGSFSTTMSNLLECRKTVKTHVSIQLMRSNFQERFGIISLLKKLGFNYSTNIRLFDSKLDILKGQHNQEMLSLDEIATYIRENDLVATASNVCNAGQDSIWINSNGTIFPCKFFPLLLGTVYDDAKHVWECCNINFPLDVFYEECKDCPEKSSCQMCIGINYAQNNDYGTLNYLNCMYAKALNLGSAKLVP